MSSGPIVYIVAGDLLGGKEVQIELQLEHLIARGVPCVALLFCDGKVADRYRARGIPCEVVDETLGSMHLYRQVRTLLGRLNPSILVTHGYKETFLGAMLTLGRALPLVIVFHGKAEPFPGVEGLKMRLYEWVMVQLGKYRAARIICVSDALRRALGLAQTRNVRVVRNVVDVPLEPFTASPPTNPPPGISNRPAVVMVGRFVPVKRFDRAIETFHAIAKLDDTAWQALAPSVEKPHLYLVGDGPHDEALRRSVLTAELQHSVHFLGFRDDAAACIGAADLFLLTSESEGIPTVLLEALVRGVPSVATAVGGIPEVIAELPDYPIELVSGHESGEFVSAIGRLLATTASRRSQKHADAARALCAVEVAATKLEQIFSECGYGS